MKQKFLDNKESILQGLNNMITSNFDENMNLRSGLVHYLNQNPIDVWKGFLRNYISWLLQINDTQDIVESMQSVLIQLDNVDAHILLCCNDKVGNLTINDGGENVLLNFPTNADIFSSENALLLSKNNIIATLLESKGLTDNELIHFFNGHNNVIDVINLNILDTKFGKCKIMPLKHAMTYLILTYTNEVYKYHK